MNQWIDDQSPRLKPGTVVVVDDSRAMRLLLARNLERVGFAAVEAPDARSALEQLETLGDVSLILADWTMPGMSGLELIKRIRSAARWATTPILMVTSETDPERVGEALIAGADDYLMKPFDRSMLLAKLELVGFELSNSQAAVEA